ncbi:hypothetical protein GGX14DRAFT_476776, partial [Mycena pura]
LQRTTPVGTYSTPGIAIFVLGRLSDVPLQYLMFSKGWAVKGLVAVGLRASNLLVTSGPGVAGLGSVPTLLTGMYAVAGLRHVRYPIWCWSSGTPTSLRVVAYNTAVNTVSTLVAVNALTSAPYPIFGDFVDCIGWKQWAGLALFATGISMELLAEASRKRFKQDPKNRGKIDDTGLWCGSLGATAALTTFSIFDFLLRGIPEISSYMAAKYGAQWEDHKRRVPSALIPGIL